MPELLPIHCCVPMAQYSLLSEAIDKAISNVLNSGQYILGRWVQQFEQQFSNYCEVAHAIGVGNGTDALYIALKALEIGPGDEVITVGNTALATIAAIVQTGATPVLVDVDPQTYTLTSQHLLSVKTENTRAIIPVHLYGQSVDMEPIMDFAKQHNLFVIEDCAQAIGARDRDQPVGSIGHLGCFSFYPTKNLGAVGDGGAITTNDEHLASQCKSLRQYGWDNARISQQPGINSRLDDLQAAILSVKLGHLDEFNVERRVQAARYLEALAACPNLVLPFTRLKSTPVYHLFVVCHPGRATLIDQLNQQGIFPGIHYEQAVYDHPGFADKIRYSRDKLPITEQLKRTVLSLPLYPGLQQSKQDYVIQILEKILG